MKNVMRSALLPALVVGLLAGCEAKHDSDTKSAQAPAQT